MCVCVCECVCARVCECVYVWGAVLTCASGISGEDPRGTVKTVMRPKILRCLTVVSGAAFASCASHQDGANRWK